MKYQGIPFDVPYTRQELIEWQERDPEGYQEYFQEMTARYGEIRKRLHPDEPHEMEFENYEDFERAKDNWKDSQAEERMARAMGKSLFARDEAIKSTPQVDWDFAATVMSPDAEDRQRGQNKLADRDLIQRLRADSQRAESAGNYKRARELNDMANAQERIKDIRDKGKYIFQEKAEEQLLSDAEKKLKEVEGKWLRRDDPSIEADYRASARCWNHESKEEFSYDIRLSEDGKSFMMVSLPHAGLTASHVAQTDGEERLAALMQLKYPETKPGEEKKIREIQSDPNDPFSVYENPQKAFEKFRETGAMPKEGLKPEPKAPEGNWEESLKPLE